MAREVYLIRDGVEVWRGRVGVARRGPPMATTDYFLEAWQHALDDGAVRDDESEQVMFRFSPPAQPDRPRG